MSIVPDTHSAPTQQLGELRAIHSLVNELAGLPTTITSNTDGAADRHYDASPSIVQRRFDALSAEAAAIASTGLAALIQGRRRGNGAAAAAAKLAHEMDRAIRMMESVL